MTETKIAKEFAEAEFSRLCDVWDIDLDAMDSQEKADFDNVKRKIVTCFCRGQMALDDTGEHVSFTPRSGEVVTFHVPTGADLMAMDRVKEGENIKKMYVLLGAIGKTAPAVFSKMDTRDLKPLMAFASLFMA